MATETQVIIVGGGLSGLTAAALLAQSGIRCMVIERHASTSIQYKFAGISPRSMEIFRGLGVEDEIRSRKTGDQQGGEIARGHNLADPDLQWGGAAWPDASPFSPTQPATCDQHVLEPILRERAESLGADTRFGTELVSFEQNAEGVVATIRSRDSDEADTITAAYLIAADGASGTIREKLGIGCHGPGVLQHWMNIIFDTDMPATLNDRRFTSCFVSDINATITPRSGGRWLLAMQYAPHNGEKPEDFDAERCLELVRKGAGNSDVRADLVDARSWEAAATVADVFQSNRCFLIGDAAHLMPPTGAFGGNSGIHDAHNLAWKLAEVLSGRADLELLGSYDAERRPIIEATLAQALARLQQWFRDTQGRLPQPVEIVPDYDVVLGQRLVAGAVVGAQAGDAQPFARHQSLSTEPGTRIRHLEIVCEGRQRSTLDLLTRDFLLLCDSDEWIAASEALAQKGFSLRSMRLGKDLAPSTESDLARDLGIVEGHAVLVRPDGFVAWRSDGSEVDKTAALKDVLDELYVLATAHEHRP